MNALEKTYGSVLAMSESDIELFEERMFPNKSSSAGFLGPNDKLKETCFGDNEALKGRGITAKQVADKLEAIVEKALELSKMARKIELNQPFNFENLIKRQVAIIDGNFRVEGFDIGTMGYQECPFSQEIECGRGRQEYSIKNLSTGKTIKVSQLHFHLIRDHDFFQGRGSPYRLDPLEACDVLDLQPGVDYSKELVRKTKDIWREESSGRECYERHMVKLKTKALEAISIASWMTVYVMPTRHIASAKKQSAESKAAFEKLFEISLISKATKPKTAESEAKEFLHLVTISPRPLAANEYIELKKDYHFVSTIRGAEFTINWAKGTRISSSEVAVYRREKETSVELGPKDFLI